MLTTRERRYLSLYLPLGIVAAVLIDGGAFGVMESPTPGFDLGGLCKGCQSSTPLGTALGVGTPTEQVSGTNHWYNFTVESAGSGLLMDMVQFQLVTATGAIVTPGVSWTLIVLAPSGVEVAAYSLGSATFLVGPTVGIQSGQLFSLDSDATDLSGQGATLDIIGTAGFQGSISVAIP